MEQVSAATELVSTSGKFENGSQEPGKSLRERLGIDRAAAFTTAAGAAAIAGALIVGGVTVSEGVEKTSATASAESTQEAELLALQKILVGGNTDTTGHGIEGILSTLGMLRAGDRIHPVAYSADVAKMEQSTEEGANKAVAEANEALSRGEPVMLIGFSLGGDVVARAGQKMALANDGKLPPNVQVVSYGGPASSTGFWAALPAKVAEPWAKLAGVDMSARLPAGSHEHGDQNDIWSNGANQYLVGSLWQAIATGTGSHRIPGENEPRIEWVDEYGVRHFRYNVGLNPLVAAAKSQNMYMAPGSEGYWNAAANAAFPINNGRDGLPNPDGQATIDNLARALDVHANSGELFYIMSRFIPSSFVQFGLDIANKAPNAFAEGYQKAQEAAINGPQTAKNNVEQVTQVPASVNNPEVPVVNVTTDTPPPTETLPAPQVNTPDVPVVASTTEGMNDAVDTVVDVADVPVPEDTVPVPEVPAAPAPQEVVQEVVQEVAEVVEAFVPPAPVEVAPPPPPAPVAPPPPPPAPVEVAPPPPVVVAPPPPPPPVPVPAPVAEVVAPVVEALPPLPDLVPGL